MLSGHKASCRSIRALILYAEGLHCIVDHPAFGTPIARLRNRSRTCCPSACNRSITWSDTLQSAGLDAFFSSQGAFDAFLPAELIAVFTELKWYI